MNLISVILLINSWIAITYAADSPVYANYLFESKQYDKAITEYKRYVYNVGKPGILDSVYLQIALSYRYLGDIKNSNKFLVLSHENAQSQTTATQLNIEKAINHLIDDDYISASVILTDVLQSTNDPKAMKQAYFYLTVADVLNADYKQARLRYICYMGLDSANQASLNHIRIISLIDSVSNIKYKDQKKARLLSSFLPGAGQIYCEACMKEVLNATLINGATIALITFSIINAHYVDAIILAILERLFYSGNRYKTEIICENYNKALDMEIQETIFNELLKHSSLQNNLE